METILSKSDFAARTNVSRARVSQWLVEGKIFGRAIVGTGVRARIRAEIAIAQLNETLDPSQSTGLNGKARLGPVPVSLGDAIDVPETVEARIKAERLSQLVLGNDKLREEAAGHNGVFCLSADVRQSEGRLAARLLTVVEADLTDMADAIATTGAMTPRDALRTLQTAWREVRVRASKALGDEALHHEVAHAVSLDEEGEDP